MQRGLDLSIEALGLGWESWNKIFNNYVHRMVIILKKEKMGKDVKVFDCCLGLDLC